jgi:hypothetical protein
MNISGILKPKPLIGTAIQQDRTRSGFCVDYRSNQSG